MNPGQIRLVQSSFDRVRPITEAAAKIFYDKLFELDPAVRPLFKRDIKAQGQMLMKMLDTAVTGLDKPETIIDEVKRLGARHAGYGVDAGHFDTVGAALLYTLAQGLGDGFTDEVRDAWAAAYGLLADLMQQGALEAQEPPMTARGQPASLGDLGS